MDSLFNKNGLLNRSTYKYTKKELVGPKVVRPREYKRTLNDRVFSFVLSLLSSPPRRCSILCSTIVASSPFSYGGLTFPTLMLLSLISNFKGSFFSHLTSSLFRFSTHSDSCLKVYYKLLSFGENGRDGIKLMLGFYIEYSTNSRLRRQLQLLDSYKRLTTDDMVKDPKFSHLHGYLHGTQTIASVGNRTQVWTMAGYCSITRSLVLTH
nr:uncharacterized protein LOC104648152 [Solanum lycopersicum]